MILGGQQFWVSQYSEEIEKQGEEKKELMHQEYIAFFIFTITLCFVSFLSNNSRVTSSQASQLGSANSVTEVRLCLPPKSVSELSLNHSVAMIFPHCKLLSRCLSPLSPQIIMIPYAVQKSDLKHLLALGSDIKIWPFVGYPKSTSWRIPQVLVSSRAF